MTLGEFVTFNLLLAMMVMPLRMIGMWIGQSQRAIASAQRIFQVLDVAPDVAERPGARELPPGGGAVRFERVSFGYSDDRPILRGIDLDIAPGSTVALIGPTGCGKTTLTTLIPRFYDVTAGRVLVDGADVRDLALPSLRGAVGIVSEETFLFSASVRDNIAYGAPWASDEDVRQAAERAQAAEFIEALPEGYDTEVGERGLTLSGGQRQRIAIARALLVDPRILILDDATASVDANTEAKIKRALTEVMQGRTTIIIAHRLSTISLAERIVVLDRGRIVADGDHDALLAESPIFREIHDHGLLDRTFVDLDGDRYVERSEEDEDALTASSATRRSRLT
jgi:ATP-binding cassette subfamily B protein